MNVVGGVRVKISLGETVVTAIAVSRKGEGKGQKGRARRIGASMLEEKWVWEGLGGGN